MINRHPIDQVFPGAKFDDLVGGRIIEKQTLYELVRKCKISESVDEYNLNREKLLKVTEGLLVKPGKVKHFVTFEEYFMKNWNSLAPMWVKAYRKRIPTHGADSTQAVERFFGVLKMFEKQLFGSRLPLISELIPAIVRFLQESFTHRRVKIENRRPRYFHKDQHF